VEVIRNIINGPQLSVTIADLSSIGECRRAAKQLAESVGFDDTQVGRICIIATEMAANIHKHASTGSVLLQVLDDGVLLELEVLGIDKGPGMVNVDQCMRDGYSTNGTAGTGLGAISRLSSSFDLFSKVDGGTVAVSRTAKRTSASASPKKPRSGFELGAISLAVKGELECGDAWRAAEAGSAMAVLVSDGLGHGSLAAVASRTAAAAFAAKPFEPPGSAVINLHKAVSGTRGAAAACLILHGAENRADYAGVGNIYGAIATEERSRGMVSHNGTLGIQLLRTQQFQYAWPAGSLAIMHSDGLSSRWNLADYPGLFQKHPAVIAGVLYRDNLRVRDDATVVVARYVQ
jgi:anti-sigma regulatory factor (Ser/Thr protein kinase)